MKTYLLSYSAVALSLFASCNSKAVEKKTSIYDLALQSKAVSILDIDISELDVSNAAKEEEVDKTLLLFRFKNADLKLLILDVTDINDCKAALMAVEDRYLKWSNSDFESAIKNNQFNGTIGFSSSNGAMLGFQFEKSILVGVSSPRTNIGARVSSECGSWSCDGCNNVFSCAGRQYSRKDWVEKVVWCYLGFFSCLMQDMYVCAREGCPY